ncbi:uncharacterized protein HMPREF1541_06177 [Cyphellophora europaea CBS 101466]|uniref:Carboxyvinyl-carboxyphosphonate phosphorylmutase n=1 Tax=Cyphellophora europaea (strain CBS 101466) TaxID=1220924 RepID=W2RUH5_CYPE1|nr:uncharacterized protein HMPREF1541_06177 [Cyphellophora europaea CBS 101466]ETN39950.1 hypothetical protein HMPREF1541_06177 [Cyphellophora europaea CBS 101466]
MDNTNGISGHRPQSGASRLRTLLADDTQILVCPGVYDGLTARLAIAQGFKCIYMTGAGTAASRLGMPDLGLATMSDMLGNASMIAALDRTVPVIADADTGYGGPNMVARTVKAYITAGVAGVHLEDQVLAKRCGHLMGKELVERDEYSARIKAAVMARDEERAVTGGDVVIIARTDALQKFGFEEAMERLRKSVELGADVAFLEGVTSIEQMKQACEMLKGTPVLLNMVPGGVTPQVSTEEARKIGYRLMIYPGMAMSAVIQSVGDAYKELYETGDKKVDEADVKGGVKRLFDLVGLQRCIDFDAKAGGSAYGSV